MGMMLLPWSLPLMAGSKRLRHKYLRTSEVSRVESILQLAAPDFQRFITDISGLDNLGSRTIG